jgi:hypothetical protein
VTVKRLVECCLRVQLIIDLLLGAEGAGIAVGIATG